MANASESAESAKTATSVGSVVADLPAGDFPPIPKWVVGLGFGIWAAWLIFLAVAAVSVRL
jgi:hypothetical protein